MIKVIKERDDILTVQIDAVTISLLNKIAIGFSMSFSTAVASCLCIGINYNMVILQEIAAYESRKHKNNNIRSNDNGEERTEQEQA